MRYIRKFNSIEEMRAAIAADEVGFIGMVHPEGEDPIMNIHVHEIVYPHDLVISCENNIVTITAEPVGEVTIEYRFNYEGEYVTYTGPFPITETVMVTARASTEDGSINRSQQCEYVDPIDYSIPFYIEDISGNENTVEIKKNNDSAPTLTIEKSLDGVEWETMGTTSTTAITSTIPANGKLYLRCNTTRWTTSSDYRTTINTNKVCNVGGNIMSLLYGSSFTGEETAFIDSSSYVFYGLFAGCTYLVDASDLLLPATTLANNCYQSMFFGCTSLTTAPVLPATTLPNYSYYGMFQNCTSLTTTPELPATVVGTYSYGYMFANCTSLTTVPSFSATSIGTDACYYMFRNCTALTTIPSILPAISVSDRCYSHMFSGCISLVTPPILPATNINTGSYAGMFSGCTALTTAPELPSTYTPQDCYRSMFSGCTSLTTAPVLPGSTLSWSTYENMFENCSSLNYIKCLATDISKQGCTDNWVKGVAATGTFVKDPSMTSWTTGVNGIPEGWVVKNPSGIALSQNLNVATIEMTELDEGTGYYTINGGSQVSIGEGTTTIPITQAMDGQTLLVYGEFDGVVNEKTLIIKYNANAIPFYIENVSGGSTTVQIKKNNTSASTLTIEKSTDGNTWDTMGQTSTTAITATIPANSKLYLRCKTSAWGGYSSYYYNTINTTGNCNVGGNIMSLLYGNSFTGNEISFPSGSFCTFQYLFDSNTHIVDASDLILPATTLATACYSGMFNGCTSLTTAPALLATEITGSDACKYMFSGCTSLTTAPALQATTLTDSCYYGMFQSCKALTAAPVLPATTLDTNCYSNMFNGCTSLTTAPELPAPTLAQGCYVNMFMDCKALTAAPTLPATTLAHGCYANMFENCISLTTAPALPATTMVSDCYQGMFKGCTSLTTAPVLPATTLANWCYSTMFQNCTNLNYIKCLATDISAYGCRSSWVSGVASTGTFVKDPNMSTSTWGTGADGIPSGWIVKDNAGIALSQNLNVATIEMTELDEGTGYYTINGGSQVSIGEGTTTIPITQAMDGQTLLVYGEFDGEATQETITLDWVDYSPTITISASNNYVTITAPNANTIQYRLGSTGEYTNYTTPVYINEDTTIYVTATRTVSGVDYTSTASQEVQHVLIPPSNLNITCTNNFVTITATGAATLEYNLDGGSSYTTYTQPFLISQNETVYAKATNSDGSITKSQAVTYVDYRPTISITENNNYVTITAPNANTIQYRLGSTGDYTNYTAPVYIASDTTIYVTATRTVSGVDYTSTDSQEVQHVLIPPTNLVISCVSNKVTITADNATTIEYNFDGSSTYTTYTEPFEITQTVTVYAKASNADGSITASQECEYQSGPDVPFAENLVFYAPLTEGDLTDHISGKSPSTDSGCTVTWNSTYNMYQLYCSGGAYRAALRWVGLSLYESGHNISTDGLTVTAKIKFISQSGNNYSALYSCDSLKDTFGQYTSNKAYLYNCNYRYGSSGTGLGSDINQLTTTLVRSGSPNIKWYKNSTLANSSNWDTSNISTTRAPDTLSLCEMHTNNTNMTILISDVRVYNRALSASEIAQL